MTVDAISVEHVKDWFASVAEQPGSVNRAMPILSITMRMAELWGYCRHNSDSCKNAKRCRMEPKARFLSPSLTSSRPTRNDLGGYSAPESKVDF